MTEDLKSRLNWAYELSGISPKNHFVDKIFETILRIADKSNMTKGELEKEFIDTGAVLKDIDWTQYPKLK
jgi:hypothetical protein